jgi:hypothetical protein
MHVKMFYRTVELPCMKKRFDCWIPGWECAMASAHYIQFSSLLGEAATYDGARTVYFWSLGEGLKMKCRARLLLQKQPGSFGGHYAGSWYICYDRCSWDPIAMISRRRRRKHPAHVLLAPRHSFFNPALPNLQVYSSEPGCLVVQQGCDTFGAGQRVFWVYKENKEQQWELSFVFRCKVAECLGSVMKPQALILASHPHPPVVHMLCESGPQVVDQDAVLVGRWYWKDVLWTCRVKDRLAWNCKTQTVSYLQFLMHTVWDKHAFHVPCFELTLCCPPEQRQFVRNMSGARLSWISACA